MAPLGAFNMRGGAKHRLDIHVPLCKYKNLVITLAQIEATAAANDIPQELDLIDRIGVATPISITTIR